MARSCDAHGPSVNCSGVGTPNAWLEAEVLRLLACPPWEGRPACRLCLSLLLSFVPPHDSAQLPMSRCLLLGPQLTRQTFHSPITIVPSQTSVPDLIAHGRAGHVSGVFPWLARIPGPLPQSCPEMQFSQHSGTSVSSKLLS